MVLKLIFFGLIHFQTRLSYGDSFLKMYDKDDSYRGEKFPQKYLFVDQERPTSEDFSNYVDKLEKVIDYFAMEPNDTDPNVAISSYFMKAILKRTLIDYGEKLNDEQRNMIKYLINKGEYMTSHFRYSFANADMTELGYRLIGILAQDQPLVYTLGNFHNNALQKWIKSNIKLNEHIKAMDEMIYPRDQFAHLVVNMDDQYPIDQSDICISTISMHPEPIKKDEKFKPCLYNSECQKQLFQMPSIAYALSHRMLYLLLLSLTRRCYVSTEENDRRHLEIMCANMYRETVYLARRGFFFKDLFLEHISFCASLGYEEFHRRHWFTKAASWVDEWGCIEENRNFEFNRTHIHVTRATTSREAKRLRRLRNQHLKEECHTHQMALVHMVLAHGIRHAAHFMDAAT